MSNFVNDLLKQSEDSVLSPYITMDKSDSSKKQKFTKSKNNASDVLETPLDKSSPAFIPYSPDYPPPGFSPHSPDEPPEEFSPHSPDEPPEEFSPHSPDEPPTGIFAEEQKIHNNLQYYNLDSSKKFEYLVREYYNSNPYTYSSRQNPELEVRFATKGKPLTKTDFDNVASKLKSFGFTTSNSVGEYSLRMNNEFLDPHSGKFRMSDIRTEIYGLPNIQNYCKTNDLKNIYQTNYSSLRFQNKKLARNSKGKLIPSDFMDFNFRVAYNIEEEPSKNIRNYIIDNWSKTKKNYRLLNRVSFYHENYPIRVDLSIVKYGDKKMIQNKNYKKYELINTYKIEDSNVFNNTESFEIEIEVINNKIGPSTKINSPTILLLSIKKIIKFILSGLQGTNFPISIPEQKQVLDSYKKLIWRNDPNEPKYISSKSFIGPNSKTLQLSNIASHSLDSNEPSIIRNNYVVTEKADGQRHLMFISSEGKVYLIDTNMKVIFTGAVTKNSDCFNCLLDGELIGCNKIGEFINLFAAFDIYYYQKNDIRSLSFMLMNNEKDIYKSRYQILNVVASTIELKSIIEIDQSTLSKSSKSVNNILSSFKLISKQFYPKSKKETIFNGCNEILTKVEEGRFDYETDGLIFTHAYYGVGSDKINSSGPKKRKRWDYSFKWKPSEFNTIDFLVTTIKNTNGNELIKPLYEDGFNPDSLDQIASYKIMELRCGFNPKVDGYINPCQDIIDDKIPEYTESRKEDYFPTRFYPTEPFDLNAGICKLILKTDDNGTKQMFSEENEVFHDNTIVEFRYDMQREDGWKWIPLRVRHDKTFELRNGGTNFGNNYQTCNSNWKSIHNPVTEMMIRTGEDIPSVEVTEDIYYNTPSGSYNTQGMKNFHNLFVKRLLISSTSKRGNNLIDLSCGRGGDLAKWTEAKLSFVFGIDYSKDNLENRIDGACTRYLNAKKETKYVPNALFVHGNSAFNIRNGNGLLNDKAKQIGNALFGIGKKDEEYLGKGVYKHYGIASKGFDICSSQFAIHYFFKSPELLEGFLRNIAECTKLNGYFIGTTYDGKTVFNLLSKVKTGESIKLMENNKMIWEIIKIYGADKFNADSSSINYEIGVYQESIGQRISEFLVNNEYFERLMDLYGMKLISNEEAKDIGLPNGSGMFEELFNLMKQKISRNQYSKNEYGKAPLMTKNEKTISFMNRYYVFKKVREVNTDKLKLELSEYSEHQEEINKLATTNIRLNISKEISPKLKKTKTKIILNQATDISDGKVEVKKKKTKSAKKIIIEED
jgi:hypothetical protein